MSIQDNIRSSIQPLKELPYDVTKKELKSLYPDESDRRISFWANEVMSENRKKPKKDIIRCRRLFHKEWKMIIEIFGYPNGYEKEFK